MNKNVHDDIPIIYSIGEWYSWYQFCLFQYKVTFGFAAKHPSNSCQALLTCFLNLTHNKLCQSRNPSQAHNPIHVANISIYMCVCVCVCVLKKKKKLRGINKTL